MLQTNIPYGRKDTITIATEKIIIIKILVDNCELRGKSTISEKVVDIFFHELTDNYLVYSFCWMITVKKHILRGIGTSMRIQ